MTPSERVGGVACIARAGAFALGSGRRESREGRTRIKSCALAALSVIQKTKTKLSKTGALARCTAHLAGGGGGEGGMGKPAAPPPRPRPAAGARAQQQQKSGLLRRALARVEPNAPVTVLLCAAALAARVAEDRRCGAWHGLLARGEHARARRAGSRARARRQARAGLVPLKNAPGGRVRGQAFVRGARASAHHAPIPSVRPACRGVEAGRRSLCRPTT